MKLMLVKFSVALLSLVLVLSGISFFVDVPNIQIQETKLTFNSSEKKATCDMSDFKGFPKEITGPVTLELKTLITVLIKSKDGSESAEITLSKSKCEVK